jgi:dihydrofolate synthase/folylpolyglutamate synthase
MDPTASFKSLDDWLPWLETLSPREIVLGLERVQDVIGRLSIRRPDLVINVAGTNGKGSSVAMLEAILRHDGVRTGCYTSPHIIRYNERIRIDGESASDADIIAALERVEAVRGDIPLTYFEFGTLAALVAFDRAGVAAWVLEVGMGGRLDAVNAIDPDASLITNVSLDHCAWLGNDVESIAREKAGVMRRAKPAVFGSLTLPRAISNFAAESGADLLVAGDDFTWKVGQGDPSTWNWHGRRSELIGLQQPALPGDTQIANASAVLAVFEALGLDHLLNAARVSEALESITLQGRFQQIGDRWILDVAHNPGAAEVLAAHLQARQTGGHITAIVGMLGDKDLAGFITPLTPFVDAWIAVSLPGSRAQSAGKLAPRIANLTGKPCLIVDDPEDAFRLADDRAGEHDLILVTGSFHVVGPALNWIETNWVILAPDV